jgi:hypothetical protein
VARIPGVLRPLVCRDLFGLAEEQAREVLLEAVAAPRQPGQAPVSRVGKMARSRLAGTVPGEGASTTLPKTNPLRLSPRM